MTDPDGSVKTELSRDMSLFDITFIGVGAMIGAGVFALTGFAAGIAGPALILAFLLNGIVAIFTAVSYAELGAAFPEAGGGYLWVKEALPDPNGFFAGWMSWFAHAVACSLYAVTFGVFILELITAATPLNHDFLIAGFITRSIADKALAALMAIFFAYINYRGAKETGKAGVIVTIIKIIILGLFIAFGIYATITTPDWPQKFLSSPSFAPNGIAGIIGAMGFTYIAFEGYEIIVQSGEEVVNPGKNVPKAVFYSLIIVIPIYILVAFAAIGGISITPNILDIANTQTQNIHTWQILGYLGELGIIQAANQFVPYGTPLLLFAGLAATMSALNATVYSSSRVSFAMGRDHVLPTFLAKIHPHKRTPHWSIILSTILIVAMAITLPIESVAASADIMFILLFIQVNFTLINMRKKRPDLTRTYKVPFMPWTPLIGIALQLILTPFLLLELGLAPGQEGFTALATTAIWMLLGAAIYYGYSQRKEKQKLEQETPTIVTEEVPETRDYQIVVPIANPRNIKRFMDTAVSLARKHNGEILVLSIVQMPQQTPLTEGKRFIEPKRQIIHTAVQTAPDDIPVHGVVKIGHSISKTILNTVKQHNSDAILMGWRHRPRRTDYILGSNVDTVVMNAPCDVLVERIEDTPTTINTILVPTAGGPHAELAINTANAIATTHNAKIRLIQIINPNETQENREKNRTTLQELASLTKNTEISLVENKNIVNGIIQEATKHDLIIMGAATEPLLQQIVFGAIPEQVAKQTTTHLIMAKKQLPVTSHLKKAIYTLKTRLGLKLNNHKNTNTLKKPTTTHQEK